MPASDCAVQRQRRERARRPGQHRCWLRAPLDDVVQLTRTVELGVPASGDDDGDWNPLFSFLSVLASLNWARFGPDSRCVSTGYNLLPLDEQGTDQNHLRPSAVVSSKSEDLVPRIKQTRAIQIYSEINTTPSVSSLTFGGFRQGGFEGIDRGVPGLCRSTAMNCETCHLNELELEPREIKDVLRCILHTIFFHRTLTLVRPKDVDCDHFEITYVQCGLAELEKEVNEKIDQFIAWAEKHPNRRSQVCLSFFDEKNKHPGYPGWFGNKTERIYWEQWFINLHVISAKGQGKSRGSKAPTSTKGQALEEASSSSRHDALGLLIQEVLFQIINFANEKKDHIPPISDRIFNHEILIPSSSDSVFGWNADVLRRALSSGHSYSLN